MDHWKFKQQAAMGLLNKSAIFRIPEATPNSSGAFSGSDIGTDVLPSEG